MKQPWSHNSTGEETTTFVTTDSFHRVLCETHIHLTFTTAKWSGSIKREVIVPVKVSRPGHLFSIASYHVEAEGFGEVTQAAGSAEGSYRSLPSVNQVSTSAGMAGSCDRGELPPDWPAILNASHG